MNDWRFKFQKHQLVLASSGRKAIGDPYVFLKFENTEFEETEFSAGQGL